MKQTEYQVVSFDSKGRREIIKSTTDLKEANDTLIAAIEGDDKYDPCKYLIEVTD